MDDHPASTLTHTATAYERWLVPALFEPWAQRLAELPAVATAANALDVGCGTGVLARAAASRLAQGGKVVGVDANPAMLQVAERLAPAIEWRQGLAESLPFDDDAFDAVLSQFGLMLFDDRHAAMQEMTRVLRSGGKLIVAVFDTLDANDAYATIADVYERVVDTATADALRFPFSLSERSLWDSVPNDRLDDARLQGLVGEALFDSVRAVVLADVAGWFPFAGIHLNEGVIETLVDEVGAALAGFTGDDGAVRFPVHVNLVTGTKT